MSEDLKTQNLPEVPEINEQEDAPKKIHGGRNLILLTLAAITFAILAVSASLYLYKSTGDIYLDRSRPGFLPEKSDRPDEIQEYTFLEEQNPTKDTLTEFLENFNKVREDLKLTDDAFGDSPLTNESLGLTEPSNEPISE
jgi:hypothetical protein